MLMAAAEVGEAWNIVSQFGPAGLAVLAVWWLSGKHEKAITQITDKNLEGMKVVGASINSISDGIGKRDSIHQALVERIILALAEFNGKLSNLCEFMKDVERRLENVERHYSELDCQRIKPTNLPLTKG